MSTVKQKDSKEKHGPGPDSDPFDDVAPVSSGGGVEVIHNVHAHTLPLAGMTVRRARKELAERLNIDPDAMAVVDGVEVDEDAVLQDGQVLNFVKHAGEKGRFCRSRASAFEGLSQ